MLTLKEARWIFCFSKIFSILNILPIEVDGKRGKIQRQSNQAKILIWKILFGVGVSHLFYILGRLIQSTVIEPEKYFRWDHFVLHFGVASANTVFYFTGFQLIVKNPEENVIIFNQFFEQREDPVQKMIDQSTKLQINPKSGNRNGKRENKTRGKTETRCVSTSTEKESEEIEMAVIQNEPETKSESEVGPLTRPLLAWPPQYSLDELLAILLPFNSMLTSVGILLIFAVDPKRPQLLYSILPPEWQNVWSFLILLTVEALSMAFVFLTACFAVDTQIMFFGKVQFEFKRINFQLRNVREKFQNGSVGVRDIRRKIWILRQISKEMRELVLFIELFNRCFPFCIFAFKINCLLISIIGYFFVFRHYQDFPLLAIFMGYIALMITLIYTIMYAHAFSIPRKMDDLKQEFLLTAHKTPATTTTTTTKASNSTVFINKSLQAEMTREMKRIRGVGIKVGSFHQMERESTPNFIDFVFNQVVSLLVTFPR